MHYSSLKRSSRSLSKEDRETVDHMLETVDKLTERIGTLETLLDSDFPDWRQNQERRQHYDGNADRSH
jgi:phage shock protein B